MQRFKTIVFNTTFALNCGLLFLLLFEQRLHVPAWLQVAGRMHPLLLHFPIVLLVLAIVWEGANFFKSPYPAQSREAGGIILLAAALTAVVTSLAGLFLSREQGYEPEALLWHKWGGVAVAVLSLLWYAFRNHIRRVRITGFAIAGAVLAGVIVTGHQGANITHGDDFLTAPLLAANEAEPVAFEEAEVFTHAVLPVLQAKCNSCHNEGKAKGGLAMEGAAQMLAGGKSGALWDSAETDLGLLLRRLHLPEESKKHMPPKGKPQLTEKEIELLERWVRSGASFSAKVVELPPTDSLRLLAADLLQAKEGETYAFGPADDGKIANLNNAYRRVSPLALGSPALSVTFFGAAQFNPKQLDELQPLKEQIVSLTLAKMPVGDGDLKKLALFKNLRRLNLAFTNITGATLSDLAQLKELRQLTLSGTPVKAAQLRPLSQLPKLAQLQAWNTALQPRDSATWQQALRGVVVETGFRGDTVVIKLNPPIFENESAIITNPEPLRLKHGIGGVQVRYTTDGTEPDSLNAPLFKGDVLLDRNLTIKTKAFKPGWISSDVVERIFFKAGFKPDSVRLQEPPLSQFKGLGAASLHDGRKSELNFSTGDWVGYREKPMEAWFYFNKPVAVSSVVVSTLGETERYILPAQSIEIWGGTTEKNLKLLKRITPPKPEKHKPAYPQGDVLQFNPINATVLKLVVRPVMKLPPWHPGKGSPAWVFVDEVFIN